MRTPCKPVLIAAVIGLGVLFAFAGAFVPPKAAHANTYPAHDNHSDEKVSIAADPYDTPAKASIFRADYGENGYLPVYVVISNDGDQVLDISKIKAELITAHRSKIQPASDDDLYRRFAKVRHRGDEPSRNPLPVPLPHKGPSVGADKTTRKEVEAAQFRPDQVPAHSTKAGFMFFDIEGIRQPLAGAHLYFSGLHDAGGQELMFFDIPMDKYPGGQPLRPAGSQ